MVGTCWSGRRAGADAMPGDRLTQERHMTDPENQQPALGQTPHSRRAQMGELLRQALQTLNTNGPSQGGAITPEALAELAQRAGIGNTSQIADLSRAMGVYSAADAA